MAGPFNKQHAGTGAQVDVYTAPSTGAVIGAITLIGTSTAASGATARIRIAPAGAADAAVHEFLPATAVAAGSHNAYSEGQNLAPGDVVRVLATAGVNVHISGLEY